MLCPTTHVLKHMYNNNNNNNMYMYMLYM